ncbi:MAG: ureidoglycolate lyase, partial [Pseudomonas sp.]
MKLLRYGEKGQERPALLDADGRLRDLSAHISDIAGDALLPHNLARLQELDPACLPLVPG